MSDLRISVAVSKDVVDAQCEDRAANPGGSVVWRGPHPFAIAFPAMTPFDVWPENLYSRETKDGHVIEAKVCDRAQIGDYKYSIAMWDGERVRICDPIIPVRPIGGP